MNEHSLEQENLTQLRESLLKHFDEEELRTLCFDLDVVYDDLAAIGRAAKARELVALLERQGRVPELVERCARLRPQFFTSLQSGSTGPVGEPASLSPTSGSPFVVGRPLRAAEPIFGRDDALGFIAGELAKFSSVNVVGERRMGKTSLINHLVGHQDEHLARRPDQPPLALACIDLQARVSHARRFYGLALRGLLAHLPASRSAEAQGLDDLRQELEQRPEADYDRFERTLRQLRDRDGVCVCPVLVVDEFERLLDPAVQDGFPYPDFFDGMRALITADLVAMVVASRRPLTEHFTDPARPNSLTSTFPTYFTPYTLAPLDDEAADGLLLQSSDHPLSIQEVMEARRWAGGHPCHLQAAGRAWYEAKAGRRSPRWAGGRFAELKGQSCMVSHPPDEGRRWHWDWLKGLLRAVLVEFPLRVGRLAQRLGARVDDLAAWIIGTVLILLLILLALGVATGGDVLEAIKKGLGL